MLTREDFLKLHQLLNDALKNNTFDFKELIKLVKVDYELYLKRRKISPYLVPRLLTLRDRGLLKVESSPEKSEEKTEKSPVQFELIIKAIRSGQCPVEISEDYFESKVESAKHTEVPLVIKSPGLRNTEHAMAAGMDSRFAQEYLTTLESLDTACRDYADLFFSIYKIAKQALELVENHSKKALSYFEKVETIIASNPVVHHYFKTIEEFKNLKLVIRNGRATCHLHLGDECMVSGQMTTALEHYGQGKILYQEALAYCSHSDTQEKLRVVNERYTVAMQSHLESLCEEGKKYFEKKEFEKAAICFCEIFRKAQGCEAVSQSFIEKLQHLIKLSCVETIRIYYSMGHYQKARYYCEQIMASHPSGHHSLRVRVESWLFSINLKALSYKGMISYEAKQWLNSAVCFGLIINKILSLPDEDSLYDKVQNAHKLHTAQLYQFFSYQNLGDDFFRNKNYSSARYFWEKALQVSLIGKHSLPPAEIKKIEEKINRAKLSSHKSVLWGQKSVGISSPPIAQTLDSPVKLTSHL